jgi:hypothetical protein
MQIDQSREPCHREGCACTVPKGEQYCSDQCRKAALNASAQSDGRTGCACGHDDCVDG